MNGASWIRWLYPAHLTNTVCTELASYRYRQVGLVDASLLANGGSREPPHTVP